MKGDKFRIFQKLLSSDLIKKTAKKYGAEDKRERKLTLIQFFWLTIFSHFHKATNGFLNMLVARFIGSSIAKLDPNVKGNVKTISRMAISKQFKKRDWRLFRDIYQYLMKIYKKNIPLKINRLFEDFEDVEAVDASVVYVSKLLRKLYKATKKAKAALKIHVKFSVVNLIVEGVKITAETVNERRYNFIVKAANFLYICDLGYYGIELFNKIMLVHSFFVSRLKSNIDPIIVEGKYAGMRLSDMMKAIRGKTVDVMVNLITQDAQLIEPVRLVGLKHEGEWYFYLTNIKNEAFKPKDIYTIYTYRWIIEIFFNELKHVLRLENIVCKNENGIKIEIYAAFILYVLLRIFINEASRWGNIPVDFFSFKRCFEIFTQTIDQLYFMIVFQDYNLLELVNIISIVLVTVALKDAFYIKRMGGA